MVLKMFPIFLRFLKEEGIYHNFRTNIGQVEYAKRCSIELAFLWCDTREGIGFWAKQSNMWADFVIFLNSLGYELIR